MQRAAATIRRSPRQAPGGAAARPDKRAKATPSVATTTPIDLRNVRASLPIAAPTTIVSSGSVDNASAPRAAVVKISDALNRIGNRAKYSTPSPEPPSQRGAAASGRPAEGRPEATTEIRYRTGTSRSPADRSRSPDNHSRYLVNAIPALAISCFRFGVSDFCCCFRPPFCRAGAWPRRPDWLGVTGLGVCTWPCF